ncbi:hypothetical protein THIOSC15_2780003 [uncultured Thiomicrorhabdus sp.]
MNLTTALDYISAIYLLTMVLIGTPLFLLAWAAYKKIKQFGR